MWLAARELMYRRATRAISQRPEPLLPASLRSLARRPRAYVGVVSCDRSHGALAFVPGRDDSAILDPSRSRRACSRRRSLRFVGRVELRDRLNKVRDENLPCIFSET